LVSVWDENVKSVEAKVPDSPSPAFAI